MSDTNATRQECQRLGVCVRCYQELRCALPGGERDCPYPLRDCRDLRLSCVHFNTDSAGWLEWGWSDADAYKCTSELEAGAGRGIWLIRSERVLSFSKFNKNS